METTTMIWVLLHYLGVEGSGLIVQGFGGSGLKTYSDPQSSKYRALRLKGLKLPSCPVERNPSQTPGQLRLECLACQALGV